ncbi:Bug family tripartite tricarboxylate transporter substrate binding protein [Bordetella bronchiseptica]|uniref:Bug family tripartite tricarboxylate transporter substrate binding protein n=1 Tax=Bordetella bronchiseptica TaxID=518 RepID=UPI0004616A72|nr:tripartite tricarboxylate transporter substrate binding protein [Bordetella bronchiseptica]KDB76349.1 tripartite tricarboxylate transporter family receptor [Bordetella bronchiseptica CARE970018BB]KDC98438.1 tripartite tricarboxylate transporter family receptor [Bordetella bronchiseptica MBORD670]KDD23490.1 tripartite tricarboxylate transporter family receptor [Bordetella bronchiseptica MBORD785]KDD35111.1 tripartite tricarboxylate transporter family receptor [Bordetella bronchiseptica MBORD8
MKSIQSRLLATWAVCAAAGMLAGPAVASGAAYPTKPVTMIVSFPPGGSSDFFTRLVANNLSKMWGQPVVVENRPGAGGNIGAQAGAHAPADGYTLYMSSINTHAINPGLYQNPGYDHIKDFAPISEIATVMNVLVVNPSVPAKSVSELLAYFKADPSKAFYASPGAGTSPHLSSELFKRMTDTSITHVPYKGSNAALTDVMAGMVPMAIDNLPAALAHIKAGKLRALAVTSPKRSPDLPDVPTMDEAGVKGYDVTTWWALFAPAGTPQPIIAKINKDVNALLALPDVKQSIAKQGAEPAPSTPEELARLVEQETARWGKVIKDAKVTID